MEIQVGDIVQMKKNHPCGGNTFEILRIGMDLRLKCTTCQRQFMTPRAKIQRNIKKIVESKNSNTD